MKYIKLFENFEGFKEYENLPEDNRFVFYNSEVLSESDIKIIENFLKENGVTKIGKIYTYIKFSYHGIITISKYKDDWFRVTKDWSEYYECDQLDGVLNCIKYLINKNPQ